jgi:HlyD family secretion protein
MYKLIKQLFSLLTTQQRKKFIWMQLLVILAAFGEIIGIASIIPFMTLVGDTNILNEPNYLSNLYANSGFNTELEFVFVVGVFVLIVLVLSSCISIFTIWRLSMFAAQIGTEIGDRLYNFYLKQNWLFHSSINSSELTNKVVNETTRITNGILMPLVTMNARIALAFFMLTGLFIYDPLVATTGVFVFGIAYVFLFIFVRSRLLFNGKKISEIYGARYLLLNEGFGGIKDILLYGRANSFVNRFNNSGMKLAYSLGNNQALTLTPRYFIELIAFAIIIILTLYLILNHQGDLGIVIPLLSVYAVAAIKILPAFQQIYLSVANIKASMPAFEAIEEDLSKSMLLDNKTLEFDERYLQPKEKILIENISFTYPKKFQPVLNNANVSIPINSVIGIVGPSGSGKSTLIDVILGLIEPQKGNLKIDELIVDSNNLRSWQNCIGFVPQSIFLSEGSILENITFGIEDSKIDFDRVDRVIKLSHLDELISTLENGIYTKVGERGVQLSGGQRQRIGIARALYKKSEVLVFDEATSSLDGISERMIMDAIDSFIGKKTIIIVAHRLKTVERCDKIFYFDKGTVLDEGSYDELIERNPNFKKMAQVH